VSWPDRSLRSGPLKVMGYGDLAPAAIDEGVRRLAQALTEVA
jgi:hypothetical protein